jgi:hypothetical protein
MCKTTNEKVLRFGIIALTLALMVLPAAFAQGGAPAGKVGQTATQTAKVDINNATEKQLQELPGIGPATAKKIIAGRPYLSIDSLAKAGVPKATIAKITPLVSFGAAPTAATPAPPTTAAKPPAATTSTAPATKTADTTAFTPPPSPGMVWVNLETKVYHKEGDRWYGKTKKGKYMTEADAIKAGYKLSKGK